MVLALKTLGLALAAVLALSAVLTSAATAASFDAEEDTVIISGEKITNHIFSTDAATTQCTTAKFAGHIQDPDKTTTGITITPDYTGCTLETPFGPIAANVNFNGCDYKSTANGEVHIECPVGKNVVVSGPGCTITIPPQTVSSIDYGNRGTGTTRDIEVRATVTGIDYSYTGFTCGSGSGTTNGSYSGDATIKGEDTELNHVGIWWTQ